MKAAVALLMAATCAGTAEAATITITITGVTGDIRVGEGPIFEHSSYQKIPPGAPFSLTYTFDDEKGKQSVPGASGDLLTESTVENTALSSPGTNAVLQIGTAVWEFGASTRSQLALKTAAGSPGEEIVYTQGGGNRISAQITPAKGGYWPRNGDWRSSFTATAIDGSTASFAADNDRVSARGSLLPSAIVVSGVDLDGQWLRLMREHGWQLAHPSPKGGYIVEQVTRNIVGTRADGSPVTPGHVQYWQAWLVPAGQNAPEDATEVFSDALFAGGAGEDNVTAVARFYEALALPSTFAVGNSAFADKLLSATVDPMLSTASATLPVAVNMTLHF